MHKIRAGLLLSLRTYASITSIMRLDCLVPSASVGYVDVYLLAYFFPSYLVPLYLVRRTKIQSTYDTCTKRYTKTP